VFLQRETLIRLVDDPGYLLFFNQSAGLRGAFGWLMIMLVAVLTWFWVYVGEKQESEQRHQEAMKLAREAELANLRQQLQPHFLFNSLNSISALAISKPEEARKMVQQLSDFLRGTIRKNDQTFVTLEEELLHLQLYLDIEKVRFGHRLKTETHCDEPTRLAQLPSLILQPVVENAIKFGLYNTTGDITITVDARLEGNRLDVTITNPYDDTSTAPSGTGFGLSAVQRRLDLLFSRQDLLKTSRQPGIFITTLTIPQPA
jgi:LytS/YehU family sensor histidine kinase